jgi:hypothetical protein
MEESVERDEEFIVVDARTSPYVHLTPTGVKAIREGALDVREISVYVTLNMMLDGMIRVNHEKVEYETLIAKFTGLTLRQVKNAYKTMVEKGVLAFKDDGGIWVNE